MHTSTLFNSFLGLPQLLRSHINITKALRELYSLSSAQLPRAIFPFLLPDLVMLVF